MEFQPEFEDEDQVEARIPTCVNAFDGIVKGGLPTGSLVLLLGEVGSGHVEFAYTSASRLALTSTNEAMRRAYVQESFGHEIVIPKRTVYISFSRSEEEVLREFKISFAPQYYQGFKHNLVFKDLSNIYFKRTPVPSSWLNKTSMFSGAQGNGESIVEALVGFLEKEAQDSLVVIDSITDLFLSNALDPQDLIYVLKGLQRASKKWNSLVYMLLTSDIIDAKLEKTIADLSDGVLVFGWSRADKRSWMRRYMYVAKFMGVLPHLDRQRVSRFLTDVKSNTGFVVAMTERV